MEVKELTKRLKKRDGMRKYLNYHKRNIYYIDLMDWSSKESKWVQDILIETNTVTNFTKNRGYKYVLVCVDGYTRYCMIRKLKSKNAKEVCEAMKSIIKTYGAPKYINCDYGGEFVNSTFNTEILKKYDIKMYHMHTENKSVYAERTIRTLKEYIIAPFNTSKGIWVDYIDNAVRKHNNTPNRSTNNHTPNELWNDNYVYIEDTTPDKLSDKDMTPQFTIGQYVRICNKPSTLQKKSLTYKWSKKLYEVVEIDNHVLPIMYKLKDTTNGENISRKYYYWELLESRYKPVSESIIKTRAQSKKTPESLREQARTHRPVTRSQNQVKKRSEKAYK